MLGFGQLSLTHSPSLIEGVHGPVGRAIAVPDPLPVLRSLSESFVDPIGVDGGEKTTTWPHGWGGKRPEKRDEEPTCRKLPGLQFQQPCQKAISTPCGVQGPRATAFFILQAPGLSQVLPNGRRFGPPWGRRGPR